MTARSSAKRQKRSRAKAEPVPVPESAAQREPTRRETGIAVGLAALAAIGAAITSLLVYGGIPHFSDELDYAFQAKVFASGHLWLQPPAVPEAFFVTGMLLKDGLWTVIVTPGFPFLLSIGYLAGIPWAVNPLAVGVAAFFAWRLARHLLGPPAAYASLVLFLLSPFVPLMGGSFMSHPTCAAAIVAALSLAVDPRERRLTAAASGLAAGIAFSIRPATAAAALAPALLAGFLLALPGLRSRRRLAPFVAGVALVALLVGAFQWAAFGSPLRTGYQANDPQFSLVGQGKERGEHGLLNAASFRQHLPEYVERLAEAGFGIPGWAMLAAGAVALARRRPVALYPLAGVAGLIAFYSGFWSFDETHGGPRYVFEALPLLAVVLAAALERIARALPLRSERERSALVLASAAGIGIFAFSTGFPGQADGLRFAYGCVPNHPLAGMKEAGVGENALVLVGWANPVHWPNYDAGNSNAFQGYVLHDVPDPAKAPVVFVRDIPELRGKLREAYPRRETWRLVVEMRPIPIDESDVGNTWRLLSLAWTRLPD